MDKLKERSLSNILFCLALVEKHLESKSEFVNYTPNNSFHPCDIYSIQLEASSMMKFVGLHDYTAIITWSAKFFYVWRARQSVSKHICRSWLNYA